MARKYPVNSAYAGAPQRGTPWSYIAGVLIVVFLLAASGILAQSGLSYQRDQQNQKDDEAQLVASPEVAMQPTDTPEPSPTPTIVVTEVDTTDPRDTVESWYALWSVGDYVSMYSLLSESSTRVIPQDFFITRYTDIVREAAISSITGKATGEIDENGYIPTEVTMESTLFGSFTQANRLQLVEDDGRWLVTWTPSSIFTQLGDTGCIDWRSETNTRGTIYDTNGVVLAEDADVTRIGVIPAEMSDPDATYRALAPIVNLPAEDIAAKVQREALDPTWFIPIRDIREQLSAETLTTLNTMDGVSVRRATARYYPYGSVAAHVTGWVSRATEEDVENDPTRRTQPDQIVGLAGVEYGANELLAGQPSGSLMVVDCGSRNVRETIVESEGVPAQDVYLTIDIELQIEVDKELAAIQGEERGAAVIIDPQTGAVLAMVSHPSFDPNDALTNSFDEEERKRIDDELLRPMANRAAFEQYPTGSIFKVITTAAAMHYLGYTGDTPIDCPATFTIGDQSWDDWVVENGLTAQGQLTLHSGLVQSCNTVFYQVGAALDQYDEYALPDMARAFGLGARTGIPYFPEVSGTIPDPEWKLEVVEDGWATGDAVNMAIGQGFVAATPLQMANVYATIANGGTVLQPYIVDRTAPIGTDEFTQVGERVEIRKLPLTNEQIDELRSALREQTSNDRGVGSSRIFGDFPWPISGKTGTAQNELDGSDKPHSWFAAYGPGDPGETATIASCVMLENVGEGISYAAPVTKSIYEWYLEQAEATEDN